MEDIRGIQRGKCLNKQCPATICDSYYAESGSIQCAYCTCAPGIHEDVSGRESTVTDDDRDRRQDLVAGEDHSRRPDIAAGDDQGGRSDRVAGEDKGRRPDKGMEIKDRSVCEICGKHNISNPSRHLNIHFKDRPKEKRRHLAKLRIRRNQAKGKRVKNAIYCPLDCGSILNDGRLRTHFTSRIHQLQPTDALYKKYIGNRKTVKRAHSRFFTDRLPTKKPRFNSMSDDGILDSFLTYLTVQLRSTKKNAQQIVSEIRRLSTVTEKSVRVVIRDAETISSAKDELIKTLSASTVRHHMQSLKKLLEYLTLKESMAKALKLSRSAIRQAMSVIDALNKTMANLVADQQLERMKLLEDESYCVSIDDEVRYREMSKNEIDRIEGAIIRGEALTTEQRHYYTQFILMDICLTNANRAGVVKNATVDEYGKMKLVRGKKTFMVHKHKTWKKGAAPVVLNDITRQKLSYYFNVIRPELVISGPDEHLLFLNRDGGPVKPSDGFPRHWFTVTGEHKKFTPTLVRHREAILSAKHVENRSERNKIASLMCHSMGTAEKYYEGLTQVSDAVEAFDLMEANRAKEKKRMADLADVSSIDKLKDKAMRNTARLVIRKNTRQGQHVQSAHSAQSVSCRGTASSKKRVQSTPSAQSVPNRGTASSKKRVQSTPSAQSVSNRGTASPKKKRGQFGKILPDIMREFGDTIRANKRVGKVEVRLWWEQFGRSSTGSEFTSQQVYDYIRLSLQKKSSLKQN
ncbi:uncharacterized protein [Amphiura filiformis]|uniref:uncharacterized protein n=1 Tax=Amphiura filiformis TaxID=82378 RepID=UPI003B20FDC8